MASFLSPKTLIKLIDAAIIPAVLIITAKILGVGFLSWVYQDQVALVKTGFGGFLPRVSYSSYQSYYNTNTWSNALMFLVVALGTAIVLIQAHLFHQSHIKPVLHKKLIKLRLARLVSSTVSLYHKAVVWLIYLWLVIGLLVVEAYLKASSMTLAVVAVLMGVNSTWLLISDVEHEIEIWREHHPDFQ